MGLQVNRELLTIAPWYPIWEALPGSAVYIQRSIGTGIDNVGNYSISNTGNVLANYVEMEGAPSFAGNILSVGYKFADQDVIPANLTINSVSVRSVFAYYVLNQGAPWANPRHFITDGSSSQSSDEFSSIYPLPTRTPWTVDRTSAFLTQPTGATWDRASLFNTIFGISFQEPTTGGGGSLFLTLAALSLSVNFELPTITPVTTTATSIRRTRCDFRGTVNPLGATTLYPLTCWFQYNKTGTFATTDPVTPSITLIGTGSMDVCIRQTNLTAGAVYAYRMVARNGAGDLFYGNSFLVALPTTDDALMRF